MSEGKNNDQPPEPRQPARTVDFVVEVSDSKNRSYKWPLTQTVLRGRWSTQGHRNMDFAHDDLPLLRQLPDIPGTHIHVSISANKQFARIFDPLADPQNKAMSDKILKITNTSFKTKMGPHKEERYDKLSPDEMKSWLYWVRRALDSRNIVVVSGVVPSYDEITKMPGTILKSNFDDSATAEQRYRPMKHDD